MFVCFSLNQNEVVRDCILLMAKMIRCVEYSNRKNVNDDNENKYDHILFSVNEFISNKDEND